MKTLNLWVKKISILPRYSIIKLENSESLSLKFFNFAKISQHKVWKLWISESKIFQFWLQCFISTVVESDSPVSFSWSLTVQCHTHFLKICIFRRMETEFYNILSCLSGDKLGSNHEHKRGKRSQTLSL